MDLSHLFSFICVLAATILYICFRNCITLNFIIRLSEFQRYIQQTFSDYFDDLLIVSVSYITTNPMGFVLFFSFLLSQMGKRVSEFRLNMVFSFVRSNFSIRMRSSPLHQSVHCPRCIYNCRLSNETLWNLYTLNEFLVVVVVPSIVLIRVVRGYDQYKITKNHSRVLIYFIQFTNHRRTFTQNGQVEWIQMISIF